MKIMSILASKLDLPADALQTSTEFPRNPATTFASPVDHRVYRPTCPKSRHLAAPTLAPSRSYSTGLTDSKSGPKSSRGNYNLIVDPDSKTGKDEWLWVVPPKPGCAIVNLGDAAVKFSNGVNCSGRHRVIPAPGVQGTYPRYSIVYFVRPTNKTVLKQMRGGKIPNGPEAEEEYTAQEWIMRQARKLRGWYKEPQKS